MNQYYIGVQLRSLHNIINRFMENYGHKKELDRLTSTNGWIIGYITENSHRDVFQKDLEKEFDITRSTASKVVNLMEQKGFIRRESVANDARLKKLVLTEKAEAVTKYLKDDMYALENRLTRGFSEAELENLRSYLERLKKNME